MKTFLKLLSSPNPILHLLSGNHLFFIIISHILDLSVLFSDVWVKLINIMCIYVILYICFKLYMYVNTYFKIIYSSFMYTCSGKTRNVCVQ